VQTGAGISKPPSASEILGKSSCRKSSQLRSILPLRDSRSAPSSSLVGTIVRLKIGVWAMSLRCGLKTAGLAFLIFSPVATTVDDWATCAQPASKPEYASPYPSRVSSHA